MARVSLAFKSLVPILSHICLAAFTIVLIFKLEGRLGLNWWWIFTPLWLFHLITSRCKCSMPAPNTPHDRQWSPSHAIALLPLSLCFEVLLCCYLAALEAGVTPPMNIALVFLPLILLECLVLADNFRMCMVLMPGEDDNMTDEALWETLPHFAVAVSMVFFLAATIFSVLKLSGTMDVLDWWDLLVNFCIGEFFAFLLCVKWVNPHLPVRPPLPPPPPPPLPTATSTPTPSIQTPLLSSSSTDAGEESSSQERESEAETVGGGGGEGEVDVERGTAGIETQELANEPGNGTETGGVADDEDADLSCGAAELGSHLLKAGVVVFQVLLCMKLEGEPSWATTMSVWALFSPLLAMHVAAILSSLLQLLEAALLSYGSGLANRVAAYAADYDPCAFLTRGMRLAGWWSMDDEWHEEQRSLTNSLLFPGYRTFDPTPTRHVKKMRKGELCEEVVRLQAALVEQADASKTQRQELEKIQQEKVLCRVCFEREISLVLMPCRHRVLCNQCAEKCKQCPICRRLIVERMTVYDV